MSVRIKPSFWRCTAAVVVGFVLLYVVMFAWHALRDTGPGGVGHAASAAATWLLALPLFVLAAWFMFVPSELAFSSEELVVRSRMGRYQVLRWDDLRYYGRGNNVFMIEFEGMEAVQIFSYAYPRDQWRQLTSFLEIRYPHNKASLWIGPFGFKLRGKKQV